MSDENDLDGRNCLTRWRAVRILLMLIATVSLTHVLLDEVAGFPSWISNSVEILTITLVGGAYVYFDLALPLRSRIDRAETLRRKFEAEAQSRAYSSAELSHEIRNPLSVLIGSLELLEFEQLSSEARELIVAARVSGDSLMSLVNNVLDVSKQEFEGLNLHLHPFDPVELMGTVVKSFERVTASREIEISVLVQVPAGMTLVGDAERLKQVLVNLISNAAKFTPPGGKILIQARSIHREAGDVRTLLACSVSDDGIGMSEAEQAKLFAPYQQANVNTSRQYGG